MYVGVWGALPPPLSVFISYCTCLNFPLWKLPNIVEGMVWHLRYLSFKFNHYHTWSEFHFIITLLPILLCVLKSLLIYRVPWFFLFLLVLCLLQKLSHLFYAFPPSGLGCTPMTLITGSRVLCTSCKPGLDRRLCQLLFFPFCKNISLMAVALPMASHLETCRIWSILSLCDGKVH